MEVERGGREAEAEIVREERAERERMGGSGRPVISEAPGPDDAVGCR